MMNSISGGVMNQAKLIIILFLLTTLVIIIIFSVGKISKSYPGYATDAKLAPSFWTGFSLGINLLFLNMARKL